MAAKYDRDFFFGSVRGTLFGGKLAQAQVDGLEALLAGWEKWVVANADLAPNDSQCAYGLATAHWETGRAMQPVSEVGKGAGRTYGIPDPQTGKVYYGRGLIQLTWRANYEVQGARLGIDLVNEPEQALRPDIAVDVMFNGMAHGQFTGKRLGEYFGADSRHDDPVNARRIINGLDHAAQIATNWRHFRAALRPATAQQQGTS